MTDTIYVDVPGLLNYKAYNHQTLHSASPRCTDSAGTLTRWPWPIFCAPVTLTHFASTFDISSTIRPTTIKPCTELLLDVLTRQIPWPGDLDLYFVLLSCASSEDSNQPAHPRSLIWVFVVRMFQNLGWMPVNSRLKYNKAVFTCNALNDQSHAYISNLLKPTAETCNSTLRSSETRNDCSSILDFFCVTGHFVFGSKTLNSDPYPTQQKGTILRCF